MAPDPTSIRRTQPSAPSKPAGVEPEQLLRATIFLEPREDAFLESIRFAGRQRTPRVDTTRSAVARLAISRLEDQLSADEIIAELAKRTLPSSAEGGRPRR